ncbi:hypothetical protein JT358_04830 [Micrococcales bacterium 31B]|nr:hypothetical protein [Micrococcales bacterium 31B]
MTDLQTRAAPTKPTKASWLRRLLSSTHELDDRAAESAAEATGCCKATLAQPREVVRVRGVLQSVTIVPAASHERLEAEIWDGSGRPITLIWIGRNDIPGINAGVTMYVEGRIAEKAGRYVLFNPKYELVCSRKQPEGAAPRAARAALR